MRLAEDVEWEVREKTPESGERKKERKRRRERGEEKVVRRIELILFHGCPGVTFLYCRSTADRIAAPFTPTLFIYRPSLIR